MTTHDRPSKLTNEKWLRRMADIEDQHASISVGGLASDFGMLTMSAAKPTGVFGRFVEFARRKQKLTVEELAAQAGVDLEELVSIEQDHDAPPQVTTVHQLASFFRLPPEPLLELAGLCETRDPAIDSAAVRFAAQSETNAELNPQEAQAFDEFVKVIVEVSDR